MEIRNAPQEVVDLLTYDGLFSTLSEAQQSMLAEYIKIDRDIMLVCENEGISVKNSVLKAKISLLLDISLTGVLAMTEAFNGDMGAYLQAVLFKRYQKYEWLQSAPELLNLLVSGHPAMDVVTAKVASMALGMDIKDLIREPKSTYADSDYAGIGAEDLPVMKKIAAAYALNPRTIVNYIKGRDIQVNEFAAMIKSYQAGIHAFTSDSGAPSENAETPAESRADWDSLSPEDRSSKLDNTRQNVINILRAAAPTIPSTINKGRIYSESDFSFKKGVNDGINLNSGALAYDDNIAHIPGRNGLALDLTAQYDSSSATSQKALGKVDGDPKFYYDIRALMTPITSLQASSINSGNYSLAANIAINALAADNYFDQSVSTSEEAYVDSDLDYFGFPYVNDWFISGSYYLHIDTYAEYVFYVFNSTAKQNNAVTSTGDNPMSYMGDGWSMKFDRINVDSSTDEIVLKFGGGSAYRYEPGVSASNLKSYPLSDIKLEEAVNAYRTSKYTLSFKDGKKEYFDANGRLLGIRDRFNNTIDFVYTVNAGYNGTIVITDTNNKITNIVFTPSLVTFTLPDLTTVKYTLTGVMAGKVMSQKKEQLNRTTLFAYSSNTAYFDYFSTNTSSPNKNSVTYNLLTSVTYSTGAVSSYAHALAAGNTRITSIAGNDNGFFQYPRAVSRQDAADSAVYNHALYTYSSNNFTGYPSANDLDNLASGFIYTTNIKWDDNTENLYTFNNLHLNTILAVSVNSVLKQKYTYVYDASKQLDTVTEQYNGAVTRTAGEFFTYDIQGNLINYWDKQAGSKSDTEHKRTFTYDSRFALRLNESYKKDGATTLIDTNTLTSDGKSVSNNKFYTNGVLTGQIAFTYDSYGNVLTKTDYASASKSIVTTYTYSGGVHLLSEIRAGITHSYTYDAMGRRLTSNNGRNYQTAYAYDSAGRVTLITNPDNSAVHNTYNDAALTLVLQNEIGLILKTTYDKLGNVKQIQDTTTATVNLESYTYDTFMRVNTHTDGLGTVTAYTYDYLGRVLTKTIGGAAYQETYAYDDAKTTAASYVSKTIEGEANAPSIKTVTYTNSYGFVVSDGRVVNNAEQLKTFTYDYLGSQLTAKTPDNLTTSYQYDGSNRLIKVINPDGSVYQQGFDWLGRKITVTDPKNAVTNLTYDDAGRLIKEEIPFTGTYKSVKTNIYDNNGNITSKRISSNKPGLASSESRVDFEYNNRDFLTKVNNYNDGIIENYVTETYDAVGNKLTMTTGNGTRITSYLYDKRSRLIKLTDAVNNFELYTYDNNSNLLTKTDRLGTITTNSYDGLNRLLSVSAVSSGGTAAAEYMTYTYYKTGARKQEKNENLTTGFVYDSAGRITQQTETTNTTVSVYDTYLPAVTIIKTQGYDTRDNRVSLGIARNGAAALSETFEYDSMNRLTKVYDNDSLQATYTYDSNGNRQNLTYGNGVVTTYAYNSANLVTSLANAKNSQVISGYEYSYQLDGNQISKLDNAGVSTVYSYDDLGRLISETETAPAGAAGSAALTVTGKAYTYDKANNRLSMAVNTQATPPGGSAGVSASTVSYTYNLNNQLLSDSTQINGNPPVETDYEYDNNGNLRYKISTSDSYTVSHFYDAFNRLRLVVSDPPSVWHVYRYRADGLRLAVFSIPAFRPVNTDIPESIHVWDGSNIALTLDRSGSLVSSNIYGVGLLKNKPVTGGYERYPLFNAHGDAVQLTDNSGAVTKGYYYDSFGVEKNQDPNDTNPWRYAGEHYDDWSYPPTVWLARVEKTYASDMDLYENYAYWPLRRDRSIDDNPLTIAGQVFDKGIGSHATSTITLLLNDGGYTRFTSMIGLDDEVLNRPDQGSAAFRVLLDGVEAYNSGPMTPGMIESVDISVAGKSIMQLITDENGDYMNDHTDWAGAVLERVPASLSAGDMEFTETYGYMPAKRDMSHDGNPLKLGGKVYAKGIGAHAPSELTFALNEKYTRFTSVVGYDDEVLQSAAPSANAAFRVLLDGVEAYNSGPMTPGMVRNVDVDVSNTTTMTLAADPNGNNDHDHADWAGAMLESVYYATPAGDAGFSEDYAYWPLNRDRSIDGNPITIGGNVYQKGLGSHADSTITVPLGGKYTCFTSIIGIDDEILSGPHPTEGSAAFKVLLNNVEVYNSGEMTPGMVKSIKADVSGKQTMQLITDKNGYFMNDHTDWANAVLTNVPMDGVYYLRARYYDPANARMLSEDP
ncbi:MAG: NPCBM/NEW2 domain-containing protein, partial [Clostridiales bacterium]|nr:NPCBM/NEW2 domain-containing protein [Clostridiales bacterium]